MREVKKMFLNVKPFNKWCVYKLASPNDNEITAVNNGKSGKWIIGFDFNDVDFISKMCKNAVETDVAYQAKHIACQDYIGSDNEGVACFYICDCADMDAHKRCIQFLLENDLIQKTKDGRLYNISFKLDLQTRSKEYGSDFKAKLHLENFVNLQTGQIYEDFHESEPKLSLDDFF